MPAFWDLEEYDLQCFSFEKLCTRAICILKDVGISEDQDQFSRSPESDWEGIDFLIDSILSGVPRWTRNVDCDAQSQEWFKYFLELLDILNIRFV